MTLENEKCHVEIQIDETYTVGSADNRRYDAVFNPCHYGHNDNYKTFCIHIDLFSHQFLIALVGSQFCYDFDCAVLDDDTLTILQNNVISQIRITDASLIHYFTLECFGCNFALYKVEKGYLIYGEMEIIMLDFDFQKRWAFSGKDIFVSVSGKEPFELRGNTICLYDFEDNYYELDFDGKQIQ